MLSEHKFGELSNSMASGFFADSVVLSLARTEKYNSVEVHDAKTIGKAVDFFSQALHGSLWLEQEKLTFDERSFDSAFDFDRAVRVLGREVTTPKAFKEKIQNLMDTAQVLAQRKIPELARLQALRDFFSTYSRIELANTNNIL